RTCCEAGLMAIHGTSIRFIASSSWSGCAGRSSSGCTCRCTSRCSVTRSRLRRFAGTRRCRKIDSFCWTPETLESVIFARPLAENVEDEVAVIHQHPLRFAFSFAMQQPHPVPVQAFVDCVADRLNLRRTGAGAQQKIFNERAGARELQRRNIHGLLVLSRFYGPANL